MIGTPPSARPLWPDSAKHAFDFSRRYAQELDYHAAQTMAELGLTIEQTGHSDILHGIQHAAFHPHLTAGGTISAGGQVILDSGVINPELLTPIHGEEVGKLWAGSGLKARMEAIIVHELTEHETGSHAAALRESPNTTRPIGEGAKKNP